MKLKTEEIRFIYQTEIRGKIIDIMNDFSSLDNSKKLLVYGGSNLIIDDKILKKDVLFSLYLDDMEKLFEEKFLKEIILEEKEIKLFFKKSEKIKNYRLNRKEISINKLEIEEFVNKFKNKIDNLKGVSQKEYEKFEKEKLQKLQKLQKLKEEKKLKEKLEKEKRREKKLKKIKRKIKRKKIKRKNN